MFFLTHAQEFKGPTWKNVVPQAQTVQFKCLRIKVKSACHGGYGTCSVGAFPLRNGFSPLSSVGRGQKGDTVPGGISMFCLSILALGPTLHSIQWVMVFFSQG
jgi:hypothetical protein